MLIALSILRVVLGAVAAFSAFSALVGARLLRFVVRSVDKKGMHRSRGVFRAWPGCIAVAVHFRPLPRVLRRALPA